MIRVEDPADLFGGQDISCGPSEYFIAAKRVLELQMERTVPAWLATSFAVRVLLPAENGFTITGEELDRWIRARMATGRPLALQDNFRRLTGRRAKK